MKFNLVNKKEDYEAPSYKLYIRSVDDNGHVYSIPASDDNDALKITEGWIRNKWVVRSFTADKKSFEDYKISSIILNSPDGRIVMEVDEKTIDTMNNKSYFYPECFACYDKEVAERLTTSKVFQKAIYEEVRKNFIGDSEKVLFYKILMLQN